MESLSLMNFIKDSSLTTEDLQLWYIVFRMKNEIFQANSGPNTNGSQFFITYAKQPHLNGVYPIFGRVIDGWETLDLMEREPVDGKDRPLNEIKIYNVTFHANPIAEKES